MRIRKDFPRDRQREPPRAFCRRCGGAVYAGERAHRVAGALICADCFAAFAAAYFARDEITVGEEEEHDAV